MLHYHGLPIRVRGQTDGRTHPPAEMAGCCFCVSYADPGQVMGAHDLGQSVMLDNGAFSMWTKGRATDWHGFYEWAEPWLDFHTTWAVIPDVIGGTEEKNDRLIAEWKARGLPRGAPVYHLHEPLDRLARLADEYERVCIGSSGQYRQLSSPAWHRRMEQAFNRIAPNTAPPCAIHLLRGMGMSGSHYPFASVDSTDIARNHAGNKTRGTPRKSPERMARRWDAMQNPARWTYREQLTLEAYTEEAAA